MNGIRVDFTIQNVLLTVNVLLVLINNMSIPTRLAQQHHQACNSVPLVPHRCQALLHQKNVWPRARRANTALEAAAANRALLAPTRPPQPAAPTSRVVYVMRGMLARL